MRLSYYIHLGNKYMLKSFLLTWGSNRGFLIKSRLLYQSAHCELMSKLERLGWFIFIRFGYETIYEPTIVIVILIVIRLIFLCTINCYSIQLYRSELYFTLKIFYFLLALEFDPTLRQFYRSYVVMMYFRSSSKYTQVFYTNTKNDNRPSNVAQENGNWSNLQFIIITF